MICLYTEVSFAATRCKGYMDLVFLRGGSASGLQLFKECFDTWQWGGFPEFFFLDGVQLGGVGFYVDGGGEVEV